MLDQARPTTAAHAAVPSSKSTRTGYEPRLEAAEQGRYREIKAFALIVGACLAIVMLYELATLL